MNLEEREVILLNTQYSNVIPVKKFILYHIFSFGLYSFYWIYNSWSLLKEEKNLDVWVLPRTIFGIFFIGSLGKHTLDMSKEYGYTHTYNPNLILASYLLISILDQQLNFLFDFIYCLAIIPLIPIVKASNFYWISKYPEVQVKEKYSITSSILFTISIFYLLRHFLPSDFIDKVIMKF